MNYKNVYFVILAGGSGTRLWPVSRKSKPKQFIAVGTNKTLLDQTIDRVCDLVPKENIWISTTEEQKKSIQSCVGNRIGGIIVEPGLRNTGPAILLACMTLQKHNPNAVAVFLPADHFIPTKERFVWFIKQAIDFALNNDHITLIGLRPTYPATGYGYIEFDGPSTNASIFKVKQFREKPSLDVAQDYIEKDNMLWNGGMFCSKVSVFAEEFKKCAPEIFEGVSKYLSGQMNYNEVKSDSVDYAVMEKSNNIFVLPVDFSWCDIGNIEVFLTIQQENMQLKNNVIEVESNNNLVDVKNKLVALIGVDNLCVVETKDALLITKRDKSEKVRLVVKQLKESNQQEYI